MAPKDYVLDLWTSSIITLVFATGAFALRFSARRLTGVHLWWDDWFVIIAYVSIFHLKLSLGDIN